MKKRGTGTTLLRGLINVINQELPRMKWDDPPSTVGEKKGAREQFTICKIIEVGDHTVF